MVGRIWIRFGILLLCCLAGQAFADVPVTSYECSPGTPGNGACSCPANYSSGRDPADEGKAICVASAVKSVVGKPAPAGAYQQLVNEANAAANAMDCDKAEGLYSKAIQLNAKGVEAMVGSGNCMAKQSKWPAAHARFDKALEINPKFEPALWSKAEAYRLAYKNDDAIGAYRNYLAAFPGAAKAKSALKALGAAELPPKKSKVASSKDVNVTITGDKIVANGVTLPANAYVEQWTAIYGNPDRTWDSKGGINRIHTWDKLGFIIYEPTSQVNHVGSVTFLFKPMKIDADPKTMFSGTFVIDGYRMTAASTIAAVKARPGATQPYAVTSVVIKKTGFSVFTMAAKTQEIDLIELGMWKSTSTTPTPPPADPGGTTKSGIAAADVRVEVESNGNVKIQKQEIGGRPMVADFKRIYGEPDRVWAGKQAVNRIHIWDSVGLLVYEPVGTGKATSLAMPYKPMETEFSPKTLFKGRVALDSKGFYNFSTIGTIMKRDKATQPYGADSVVFDLGDVHIFTKGSKQMDPIELVELSFWQKK